MAIVEQASVWDQRACRSDSSRMPLSKETNHNYSVKAAVATVNNWRDTSWVPSGVLSNPVDCGAGFLGGGRTKGHRTGQRWFLSLADKTNHNSSCLGGGGCPRLTSKTTVQRWWRSTEAVAAPDWREEAKYRGGWSSCCLAAWGWRTKYREQEVLNGAVPGTGAQFESKGRGESVGAKGSKWTRPRFGDGMHVLSIQHLLGGDLSV